MKKAILFILTFMFLISLAVCARYCMQYEKAVKDTASAEERYEQFRQNDADRASNDWNYAMNLGSDYVAQRKESQSMIERAQEVVWEKENTADTLGAKAMISAGVTIILFIITCILYVRTGKKYYHKKPQQ